MSKKFLYLFKEGHDAFGGDQTTMKNILGGKGAGLAEMTHAGMPVPQGFTITTEACTQYYADNREINDEIKADIFKYMGILEEQTGEKFGDIENPLLVSVRSGARQSMPGMMDTILNLGLNDQAVEGLAKKTSNPRFAYDCYRRFIQMYSDVVMEVGKKYFEQLIDRMKEQRGVTQDVELTADDLRELSAQFKAEYRAKIGEDFPTDPKEQLMGAVAAQVLVIELAQIGVVLRAMEGQHGIVVVQAAGALGYRVAMLMHRLAAAVDAAAGAGHYLNKVVMHLAALDSLNKLACIAEAAGHGYPHLARAGYLEYGFLPAVHAADTVECIRIWIFSGRKVVAAS